jgi:thioredoxin 1|uniref:Thioredoxin domain-containing protein n=1 Tax=viral metagenome TaxID=1070528 RepID=A0A6C0C1X8_9ZZZZ
MGGETVILKTRNELKEYVKRKNIVIVKVSATWCGPCKKIGPQINQLFDQMNNNVSLVLVDADEGSDICSYLRVKTVPYLINYINGSPQDILTSSKSEDVLNFFNSTHVRTIEEFKNNLSTNQFS